MITSTTSAPINHPVSSKAPTKPTWNSKIVKHLIIAGGVAAAVALLATPPGLFIGAFALIIAIGTLTVTIGAEILLSKPNKKQNEPESTPPSKKQNEPESTRRFLTKTKILGTLNAYQSLISNCSDEGEFQAVVKLYSEALNPFHRQEEELFATDKEVYELYCDVLKMRSALAARLASTAAWEAGYQKANRDAS